MPRRRITQGAGGMGTRKALPTAGVTGLHPVRPDTPTRAGLHPVRPRRRIVPGGMGIMATGVAPVRPTGRTRRRMVSPELPRRRRTRR